MTGLRESRLTKVTGRCPMGCGDTLFLGEGGHVTCSWHRCPNPGAVTEWLNNGKLEEAVRDAALHTRESRPYAEIVRGADPNEDWRAPFVSWTPTELFAAAHAWVGMREILEVLLAGDMSVSDALVALEAHELERRV